MCELDKRIKQTPCPIPKISDMPLDLKGFQWATSLDLNMRHCHIKLDGDSKKLCTLVFPWDKHEMQHLPMGSHDAPCIFQEKMSKLFADKKRPRAHTDNLLVFTDGVSEEHLEQLDEVLKRLKKTGLKVNSNKSFFCHEELECLGHWITQEGIQPLPKKVQAIANTNAARWTCTMW